MKAELSKGEADLRAGDVKHKVCASMMYAALILLTVIIVVVVATWRKPDE